MPATVELSDELVADLVARVSRPDFGRLQRQLKATGWCARPVRLRGYVCDHNGVRVWSTGSEPDGVLRKACGNRREAVCPSCAERYRQDAFQLISAGLRGGKGLPESVSSHPLVFATFTAPGFGAVHTRSVGADGELKRCRPRRDRPTCEHGHPMYCNETHGADDECLGQPICEQCFDHERAVMFNNLLGRLWGRTTTYLLRKLAKPLGITQKKARRLVRVSYVKVAEYQRRGLVHLHVVIRLDRAMPKDRAEEVHPPDERFTTALLEDALRDTVQAVTVAVPAELGGGYLNWGEQLDIRRIGVDAALEPGRCAGYLAKYATKATEQAGGVLHPVHRDEIDRLRVSEHVREFIRAAFDLDDHDLAEHRLARNAHNLGYRGHCLTRSRRYSITFKRLREAREDHVHQQLRADQAAGEGQRRLAELGRDQRVSRFTFVGIGHLTTAEAFGRLRPPLRPAKPGSWPD